jgi:hypothetical protein
MRGHLKERSPGHWAIVIDLHDPAIGKRRRKWHSHRGSRREAQKECARLIHEMNVGAYIVPSKATLAAYLEVRLGALQGRHYARHLLARAAGHAGRRGRQGRRGDAGDPEQTRDKSLKVWVAKG